MEETVADYYRLRDLAERVDLEIGEKLDTELFQLFEPPGSAPASAAQMLRDQRQTLIQAATQYSGVNRAVVRSVVDHLTDRTEQPEAHRRSRSRERLRRESRFTGHRAGDERALHGPTLRHRVAESRRAA